MINWREKFIAMAIHFAATLLLAGVAAALIFLLWYPGPFAKMLGGAELFFLVVGCDVALGPLLSLVVYNSQKSRFKLWLDYTVIGLLQIGSLTYGVWTTVDTRPVYVVFSLDRYEIVLAGDFKETELAAARDPKYRELSWTGPRYVAVSVPAADHNDALFEALNGNEEHQRPRFYVPYESQLDAIRKRLKPLADLEQRKPESKPLLRDALRGVESAQEQLGWLPVRHFRGFWTVVLDTETAMPVAWIPLDPYDDVPKKRRVRKAPNPPE